MSGLPSRPRRLRLVAALLVVGLVLAGCRPFGPGTPRCGDVDITGTGDRVRITVTEPSGEVHRIRPAQLVGLQAVPTAEWGPCVVQLPRGWDLQLGEPRSGEVSMDLYAAGLGYGAFLTITLTEECEVPDAARRSTSGDTEVQRWIEVRDRSQGMAVTVVPVAARHEQAAYELATDLGDRDLRGSRLRVSLSNVIHGAAEERIEDGLEGGSAVIVVDDDLMLRDELELRLPTLARPINGSFGTILTELAQRTDPPRYDATWWELSDGACTTYEFSADGPDAGSIEADVEAAIGRFPLGELRRGLAEHGIDLDPGT